MAHAQPRYAPRRRSAVLAWFTALVMPALVGWAFWSATADVSGPAPSQPVVTAVAAPR